MQMWSETSFQSANLASASLFRRSCDIALCDPAYCESLDVQPLGYTIHLTTHEHDDSFDLVASVSLPRPAETATTQELSKPRPAFTALSRT